MKNQIHNIRNEFIALCMDAQSEKEIEDLRVNYLGRNGKLTNLIKKIKDLPESKRKDAGTLINETKSVLLDNLEKRENEINKNTKKVKDPTVPGIKPKVGHLHLITQAIDEIERIFSQIGFRRRSYREVDWDWYAFEALNFPPNHPARDDLETYWIKEDPHKKLGSMLLTPHTSNGQVREMERFKNKEEYRMLNISKVYRRQQDISHTPMFHQFEGMVIDKNISIANLKATLEFFVHNFFSEERKIRFRPHNFEFTEPSFELDISCDICDGKGCRLCKQGWLELAGAGMIHPNVLKAGGLNPNKYSGFAFGAGVERVVMMKSGLKIGDLRTLYSRDIRYLTQF